VRSSRARASRTEAGGAPLPEGQTLPPDADNVVYVVDDDASVRRSLSRLIRAAGFYVATFPSAQAFLEQPLPEQTACLIVDVRLPGPSGLDLQAILGRAEHATPIIFLTGYGNVPMSVQAMKGGAVDFLQKPFDETELLLAVERALTRCRQTRSERAERTIVQQRFNTLTQRERQVLGLVVAGLLNKQIAAHLGAAEKTIKIHRGRVMRKMQADSVADLVRMTQRIGVAPSRA
jgi:FixJ family two-component response regulator